MLFGLDIIALAIVDLMKRRKGAVLIAGVLVLISFFALLLVSVDSLPDNAARLLLFVVGWATSYYGDDKLALARQRFSVDPA